MQRNEVHVVRVVSPRSADRRPVGSPARRGARRVSALHTKNTSRDRESLIGIAVMKRYKDRESKDI
jgi:hypothetical protein